MNAIQTYWVFADSNTAGGWINKRFEYIAWSLSYFLLKRNFGEVHLYGNEEGCRTLSQELGLKYDKVVPCLDDKKQMISDLWTLGKIYVYALQDSPFVHVDGDVFWFGKPSEDFLNAGIFAQSIEMGDPVYENVIKAIKEHNGFQPKYWDKIDLSRTLAFNFGIIGGNETDIFQHFFSEAKNFYEKNKTLLRENPKEFVYFYLFVEQFLFASWTKHLGLNTRFLKKPIFKNNFKEILDFNQVSSGTLEPDFIHLIGAYKYMLPLCNQMENWLARLWPEQLKHIESLCEIDSTLKIQSFLGLNPATEKKLPLIKWKYDHPRDALDNYRSRSTEQHMGAGIDPSHDLKYLDCVKFEMARKSILEKAMDQSLTEQHHVFEKFIAFCRADEKKNYNLAMAEESALVWNSEYNWFNNLVYTDTSYWYHLVLDSQKECLQEFLFTERQCQILDFLNESKITKEIGGRVLYPVMKYEGVYNDLKTLFQYGVIKIVDDPNNRS